MRSHILQLCKLLLMNQCNSELQAGPALSEPLQTLQVRHLEVTASETFVFAETCREVFKPDQSPESRHKLQLYCFPSNGHLCKGMILQLKKKRVVRVSALKQAQKI